MRVCDGGELDHQIHPVVSQEATGFFFVQCVCSLVVQQGLLLIHQAKL